MGLNYRNFFLLFGIVMTVLMIYLMEITVVDLLIQLKLAGFWLLAIIALWLVIYCLNTLSWYVIINDGLVKHSPISYIKLLKISISSFSLNYITPGGLMGGEPYRVLELTPYVGGSKATSSVILFVMMHIMSHFVFWFFSIILYFAIAKVDLPMTLFLSFAMMLCLLLGYFFFRGYRSGMAVKTILLCGKIPFLKRWATTFLKNREQQLIQIDKQIAQLHAQHKATFYGSLGLEFAARILACLEVYFIMAVLTPDVNFVSSVLIVAFSSLFANIFFFSPLQAGTREGGFAIAVSGLAYKASIGIYVSLLTRVRELFWIIIGMILIKMGNTPIQPIKEKK